MNPVCHSYQLMMVVPVPNEMKFNRFGKDCSKNNNGIVTSKILYESFSYHGC